MEEYKAQLTEYINNEEKEKAVLYAIELLNKNAIDIVALYQDVLAPILNRIASYDMEQEISIWQEHIRSSIVRSIIECCYPYVIAERDNKYKLYTNKKVLVLCPTEEYHDIGARMVVDFFTLYGYNAIFIGSNTPKEEVLLMAEAHKPDYLAISVSNYYHLVAAEKSIRVIRENYKAPVTIIVGGYAFNRNPNAYIEIGADIEMQSFNDIKKLEGREGK